MTYSRIYLHEITPKPLLVVNGVPIHYHEATIDTPDAAAEERELGLIGLGAPRSMFRPTFPFHLTVGVYLAPALKGASLWKIRNFHSETWAREVHTPLPAGKVPFKRAWFRERVLFDAATEPYAEFPEYQIRSRAKGAMVPLWMSDRSCQYMEDGPLYTKFGAPPRLALCPRHAAYVIMWVPRDLPAVDHFGYICEHHKPQYEQFIAETTPAAAADYKYRKLRPYKETA